MKRKRSSTDNTPTAPEAECSPDEEATFKSLGLDTRILQGIAKLGFAHPTAVQAKAVPLALEGRDILARAKTGSGKTAAYLLPVLQSILRRKESGGGGGGGGGGGNAVGPSALLLVPTRELAHQVHRVAERLAAYCGKLVRAVNIAQNVSEQVWQSLLSEAPDIVIATPSRAVAALSPPSQFLTTNLNHIVIDEADLVLSYGYEDDLQAISRALPKGLQTFLASATLTDEVDTLKKIFCRSPVILRVHDTEDSEVSPGGGLKQYVVRCAEDEKFLLLYVIFKLKLVKGKSIVFVGDIDRCYRVRLFLEQFGIRACVLNSELPVNSRLHIVQEFNKNVYEILIATDENEVLGDEPDDDGEDVDTTALRSEGDMDNPEAKGGPVAVSDIAMANTPPSRKRKTPAKKPSKPKRKKDKEYGISRGIDFYNVSCVLNFDLPTTSRSYTHRIGRTARAGRAGMALSFVVPTEFFGKHKATSFPLCVNDEKVLARIQRHQRKRLGLPAKPNGIDKVSSAVGGSEVVEDIIKPYVFDMTQVNAFRYRMDAALRAVTKLKIREARLGELRNELATSEKLKRWFEENPGELKALRHDGGTASVLRQQPQLKHVPDYLLPKNAVMKHGGETPGTVSGGLTSSRVKRARFIKKISAGRRMKGGKAVRDPLKTFRGRR